MEVNFLQTKNGQLTANYNSINLHSTYNPEMEAQRFVNNIECNFIPEFILITEPGLSYCVPFLKEKFSSSKIICIRYIKGFEKYNSSFYAVINYWEHKDNFEAYLFNLFGEEKIFKTLFLKWDASSKAFSETDTIVWNVIKKNLQTGKTLLVTREYFEKKWFINSVKNLNNLSTDIYYPDKTDKPVLIIASGPSLKPLLKQLSEIRNNFYIICLSSAISIMNYYKIIPDLYLSTDGGYWAGQHLKKITVNNKVPLALPLEAYCPSKTLKSNRIIPLNYGDGLSSLLINKLQLQTFPAERNGTVSGTALKLAFQLTDKPVYFTGLDLHSTPDFSHTNPNEIEINNSLKDFRLNSKEKRTSRNVLGSASLDIYRDWFANLNLNNRVVYRIIDNPFNSLGQIKDISSKTFINSFSMSNHSHKESVFTEHNSSLSKHKLKRITADIINDENNLKQLFPLEYTTLSHNPGDQSIKDKISIKTRELNEKIEGILSE